MFLNLLNQKEKESFIEMAYHAMKVNGEIKESELNIYNAFKVETGLTGYELRNIPLDELIRGYMASTKKVKKAIIMELLAILVADGNLDRDETGFIHKLANEWNIRQTEVNRMSRWVEDFNELLEEGFEYIMK